MMDQITIQKEILSSFNETTQTLLHLISGFSSAQMNRIPSKDSWTAAQVADHIIKSDASIIKAIYGQGRPTVRQPDENIEGIKTIFLDFTTKLKSPEFILPDRAVYDKETVAAALAQTRKQLGEAITSLDLSATCVHEALGTLTRLEMLAFVNFHTQRHIHQLKKIFQLVVDTDVSKK